MDMTRLYILISTVRVHSQCNKEEDPTTGEQTDLRDKDFGVGFFVWLGALILVIVAIEVLR